MFGYTDYLIDLKYFLEHYSLALIALAFITYTVCVTRVTAFNLVVFACILLQIIHLHITRALVPLFGVDEFKSAIFFLWYTAFAITDILFVLACHAIIRRYNLIKDRASSIILNAYYLMASLQLLRLFDRQVQLDVLGPIYQNGIVAINATLTVIILIMAVRAVLVRTGKVLFAAGRQA